MAKNMVHALLATHQIERFLNTPIGHVAVMVLIVVALLSLMRPVRNTQTNIRRIQRAGKYYWLTPVRLGLGIIVAVAAILLGAPPVSGFAQQLQHPWVVLLLAFGVPLLPFVLFRLFYVSLTPRMLVRGKEVVLTREARHRLSFHVRQPGFLAFFYRPVRPGENNVRAVVEVFQTYEPHFTAAGFHTIEFISPDITDEKVMRWVNGFQEGKHRTLFLGWNVARAEPIELSMASWLMLVAFRFNIKAPKTMHGIVLTAPRTSTQVPFPSTLHLHMDAQK
jgi:hypothetical protein